MQHSYMRGFLLLALALILGFALMGFEMLGSRYLYPYFGGGINTWASLIATVLVALMRQRVEGSKSFIAGRAIDAPGRRPTGEGIGSLQAAIGMPVAGRSGNTR